MPLLDHFHPPLSSERHSGAFHGRWAAAITDALNDKLLPRDYFAEMQVHVGSRVEVDVGSFNQGIRAGVRRAPSGDEGGVATMEAPVWAPPVPVMQMPAIFPDSVEVLVYGTESGATLVAAVELISPGNKDRAEARRAFASKCSNYLQQGVGLMIVDVVTNREANLHNELVELLGVGEQFSISPGGLYSTAYRPVHRANDDHIDVWISPLTLGQRLPLLPLALDKGICLPLDLEPPYAEAGARSKLPL
jgi:hypothetical protein